MQVVKYPSGNNRDGNNGSCAEVLAAWKREGGKMPIGAALPMNGKWEGQPLLPLAGAVVKGNQAKTEKRQQTPPCQAFAHRYFPEPDRVMF